MSPTWQRCADIFFLILGVTAYQKKTEMEDALWSNSATQQKKKKKKSSSKIAVELVSAT